MGAPGLQNVAALTIIFAMIFAEFRRQIAELAQLALRRTRDQLPWPEATALIVSLSLLGWGALAGASMLVLG